MFHPLLLNTEVQHFIRNYTGSTAALAFKGSPFPDIPVQELMQQIDGRRRIEKKLPLWFDTPNVVYPPKLNLEQTSSETTAIHKASLVTTESLADLTGGFGIDSYYFADRVEKVHHFEIDKELSDLAKHNFQVLKKENIECFSTDGIAAVSKTRYQTIYADPSRRHDSKGKVFFLKDCEPNIPEALPTLLQHCETLLLKTSPMLDINVGIEELKSVSEIHILAVNNDVKEVLWIVKENPAEKIKIDTINFKKTAAQRFAFILGEESQATYSLPQQYLYEPNAAILKSGGFTHVSKAIGVEKLHANTHLYTSDELMDFPGRRFLIEARIPYQKSAIKKALAFSKANVSTRNFPESVKTIRKKWKIKDGGSNYLFFITTLDNKKEMLICSKV